MQKKAIVFDNSGTLLKRSRVVKNLKTSERVKNSSLDIIDRIGNSALVVLQADTKKCIMLAKPEKNIYEFIKDNDISFDISYSSSEIKKEEVLPMIENSSVTLGEFHETARQLKSESNFIELCSGSAFVLNTATKEIEYIIAAGGNVFPHVKEVIKKIQEKGIEPYIASGDRSGSLYELAKIINLPKKNVFETANTKRKAEIIDELQNKGYKVMMVGNGPNDILAFKKSDLSVLTLEDGEKISKKVFKFVDIIINDIHEVLNIEF